MRRSLHEHKRSFYLDAQALARNGSTKGYVVAATGDPARLYRFLEVLARHDIKAYRLRKDIRLAGETFAQGESFVIPAAQTEFRFLQDLFARRTHHSGGRLRRPAMTLRSNWSAERSFKLMSITHIQSDMDSRKTIGYPCFETIVYFSS